MQLTKFARFTLVISGLYQVNFRPNFFAVISSLYQAKLRYLSCISEKNFLRYLISISGLSQVKNWFKYLFLLKLDGKLCCELSRRKTKS